MSKLFSATRAVMRVAGDAFFTCVFCYLMLLLACVSAWEVIERWVRGPAEEPAPRQMPGEQEPDEWEKLSAEDQAELRQWLRN